MKNLFQQFATKDFFRKKSQKTLVFLMVFMLLMFMVQGCKLRTPPTESETTTETSATTATSQTTTAAATPTPRPTTTKVTTTKPTETSESETTETGTGTETKKDTSTSTKATTTQAQVTETTAALQPTATAATTTTAPPPPPPTTTTTAPKPSGGTFNYVNYGAFFRDNYGSNANYVNAEYGDIIAVTLDVGSAPNGVVLVKVDRLPANVRCLVQISKDGTMYQYELQRRGSFVGIPLQMGSGAYNIAVAYDAGGTFPAPLVHSFNVSLASGLKPYTASSIITDFSRGSASVSLANSLCSGQSTLDGKIDAVYNWITKNISYNRSLASQITNGQVTTYIPNPDQTLSSRTGICYDYASLMCAMLRSQGIATRLIMGNTPQGYHAWNEVYIDGVGWVIVAGFSWQQLSGASWVRFDTTFAAGGMSSQDIKNNSYSTVRVY